MFPTACSLCLGEVEGVASGGVCQACWQSLTPWVGAICSRCGLPLAADPASETVDVRCGECRRGEYDFDWARSYGLYSGPLRAAVLQLKFHRRERVGRKLGERLAWAWPLVSEICHGEALTLVPVPLHRSRQRQRGFNQAGLLSRGLLESIRKRRDASRPHMETHCLVRTRPTAPQTGLIPRARRENVRGVFAVRRPDRIHQRNVILVDDVMTTGATVSECAAVLKRAGARRVIVLTVARATPQFPDVVPTPPGAARPARDAG